MVTTQVPQFHESRTWARKPGVDVRPDILATCQEQAEPSTDENILSMREVSFEQQRAVMRHPLERNESGEQHHPRLIRDSTSSVGENGTCRTVPNQCWKSVKATIIITRQGSSNRSRGKRVSSKKSGLSRTQNTRTVSRYPNRIPLPSKVRIGNQAKFVRATPRIAVTQHNVSPRSNDERISHRGARPAARSQRPLSTIPSLHDPEKDSRFSQECRAMLSSLDFNRDWTVTPPAVLPGANEGTYKNGGENLHQQTMKISNILRKHISLRKALSFDLSLSPSQNEAQRSSKEEKGSKSSGVAPGVGNFGPGLMKSRAILPLSPFLRRATQQHVTDSLPKVSAPGPDLDRSGDQTAPTHTLTIPRERTEGISRLRASDPPSIPPERPLPPLPSEAGSTPRSSIDTSQTKDDQESKPTDSSRAQTSWILDPSTMSLVSESLLKSAVSRSREVAMSKGLSVSTDIPTKAVSRRSGEKLQLVIPRSFASSESSSTKAASRADSTLSRVERVKEKRRRDIAASRLSEPIRDPQTVVELLKSSLIPDVTPEPSSDALKIIENLDALDQFPAVPESRPISFVSTQYRHSPRQSQSSLVRQPSKASSTRPGQMSSQTRQMLSQSNIFVVVDSDPITQKFRAGAMSPAPSIGTIGSHYGTPSKPRKHGRRPSQLREVTTGVNVSRDSLKSQRSGSPTSGKKKVRKARRRSNLTSSSDDSSQATTSPGVERSNSRAQKRRRWNSTDISLVQGLQRNLEEYYDTVIKQEERIRWQATQMQMMVRVIRPMHHARGIKTSLPDTSFQGPPTSSTPALSRFTTIPSLSPPPLKPKSTRASSSILPTDQVTLPSKKSETQLKPLDERRPSAESTASSRPRSPTSAKRISDASLTDPCEYDLTFTSNARASNIPLLVSPAISPRENKDYARELEARRSSVMGVPAIVRQGFTHPEIVLTPAPAPAVPYHDAPQHPGTYTPSNVSATPSYAAIGRDAQTASDVAHAHAQDVSATESAQEQRYYRLFGRARARERHSPTLREFARQSVNHMLARAGR